MDDRAGIVYYRRIYLNYKSNIKEDGIKFLHSFIITPVLSTVKTLRWTSVKDA